jgi:GntR family transcriptional regulator
VADSLYRRIAETIRAEIEAGTFGPGSRLPTELELADRWGTSRSTIRDAIKVLTTKGLVDARPGQGTFVVGVIDPFVTDLSANPDTGLGSGEGTQYKTEVAAKHRAPRNTVPRVEVQRATSIVAAELRLQEGSSVVSRHQQRFIDEMPYSLQTSFYSMNLVARGAQRLIEASDIEEGTVRYLRTALGIEQAGYRDVITVRTPDTNETAFFKLPADGRVAVFENFRAAFDQEGIPFRLTITVYPTDRNQFVINVLETGVSKNDGGRTGSGHS